jgi:uncharacterized protein
MANQGRGSDTSNRGFASMDDEKQREIASKGGQASGGNFKNDPERASEAGRKGGEAATSRTIPSVLRKLAGRAGRHPAATSRTTRSGRLKLAARAGSPDHWTKVTEKGGFGPLSSVMPPATAFRRDRADRRVGDHVEHRAKTGSASLERT